jgi:hypothetical protein
MANDRHFRDSRGNMWGYGATTVGIIGGRVFLHRLTFKRDDPSVQFLGRPGLSIGTGVGPEQFTPTWLPYKHETRPLGIWTSQGGRRNLGTFNHNQWTVPLWLLVPLFAIPPVRWARRRRREKLRNAAALCVRCGYDLRASHDRCPECGEPIRVPASIGL